MDTIDTAIIKGVSNDIDIGDVIEVIETDPDYTQQQQQQRQQQQQQRQQPSPSSTMHNGNNAPARCVIVEEPAQKQLRFRYECEGRSAGSIPGANSTQDSKTYPTIKIEGFVGRGAVVVVSCVTKDEPYRPHPHKLVGREGCKRGVCTVNIPEDTMTVSFPNLGIQCVKKKDIEDALKTREEIRVDPFRTGFSHRASPTSIDLNAVRLCFQVFLPSKGKNKFQDLEPVVSQPIFDKKAMSDLIIVKLSDCVCPVDGGNKDIILLCEKVTREDIQVRFYEEKDGKVVWEANGEFQPNQVHKQTAIWFRPPKYKTLEVTEPVKMFIQLRRPSDGAVSQARPFQMVSLGGKRRAENMENISYKRKMTDMLTSVKNTLEDDMPYFPGFPPMEETIKTELNDNPRSPFHGMDQQYRPHQGYGSPMQNIPSTSTMLPPVNSLVGPTQNYPTFMPPPNIMPTTYNPRQTGSSQDNQVHTFFDLELQEYFRVEPGTEMSLTDLTNNLSSNLSTISLGDLDQPMTNSLDRLMNNEVERHLSPPHQPQLQ